MTTKKTKLQKLVERLRGGKPHSIYGEATAEQVARQMRRNVAPPKRTKKPA